VATRRFGARARIVVAAAVLTTAAAGIWAWGLAGAQADQGAAQGGAGRAYNGPRAGIVQMFDWRWDDIARECTNHLGPKGFWAVQTSPPNEHARISGDPWWERYQPVSYRLDSRSGNRAAFASMVSTCRDAGVKVIADVVVNHMTGSTDGNSIEGRPYRKYHYDMYSPADFHQPTCLVDNYHDRGNVQNCELVELSDLNTSSDYVRQTLANYLNDLLSIGVAGFRVDAAKHISAEDLTAVFDRVNGDPYVFTEVIDYGGEAVGAGEYTGLGDVTEFRYGAKLAEVFRSGRLATLFDQGQSFESWGVLRSEDAVPFVANHDTVRGQAGGGVLSYKDGSLFNLAQVFTLAWPYGNPALTSEFAWSNKDAGPPSGPDGKTNAAYGPGDTTYPSGCRDASPWVCEHRWGNIANMIAFRAYTSDAWSVDNRWSNGGQQIAFSRGNLGFVAINREGAPMDVRLQTGLPAGTYCQVLSGEFDPATRECSGSRVTVESDGTAQVTVPPMNAFALHAGSKLP